MIKTQERYKALSPLLLCLALAAGCGADANGDTAPAKPSKTEITSYTNVNTSEAVEIILSNEEVKATGGGVEVTTDTLTITAAGDYILSGDFTGSIIIDAAKEDRVQLILNNVNITGGENAAIYSKKAGTLIITLPEGSVNTLADGENFAYAAEEEKEPNAALFSNNNLIIEGSGRLFVTANFNNGIQTKDTLTINGGNITISAENHGIRGKDGVTITGGDINITAGNDGIQSNNDTKADKGFINLSGGNYSITAANDGIQAETTLTITGGSYNIITGGGSENTPADPDGSYKGLKAGEDIEITGGNFSLDCADDTIHANGNIRIAGGNFTLSTGDDGIHADNDLKILGGAIDILKSYEGIEAMTITIDGGNINLAATDDGINAAGGTDSRGFGRDFGSQTADAERWLKITGGTIYIDAGGDGIDINGNGEITGGAIYVSGATGNMDAAIDYDGTLVITGGIVAATGSSGMAQAFGGNSTQPSIMVYLSAPRQGGEQVVLKDGEENILVEYSPAKQYTNIVISTPELIVGQTYSLYIDDEKITDITLTDTQTSVSDTGEAVTGSGMFGGGMGGGGMGGGRGGQRPGGNGGWDMPEMPGFDGDRPEKPAGEGREMPEMPDFDRERRERPAGQGDQRPQ